MCIFQGIIEFVLNTGILLWPLADEKRQLTIYANRVKAAEKNVAMIFSFPAGVTPIILFFCHMYVCFRSGGDPKHDARQGPFRETLQDDVSWVE